MKKILFIFLALILFLVFLSWYNANPKVILERVIKNKGSLTDRQLVYRVYFLKFFPVGEGILMPAETEEYRGEKVYHLSASAHNLRIFSNFVNAYANLDSYIDTRRLNPVLFKQKLVVTGRKDIYREIFYDQLNHVMSIEGVRRQIYPDTQDPLSAIFNLRRRDFKQGGDLEISINTNQKNYILKGTATTSAVSLKGRTYKIALLKATISRRDKNNPYHRSNITVTLLNGEDNVPLTISVFTRGIFINARLADIR